MKILYLSDFDMLTRTAHTNQIYKCAAGFTSLGHDVEILAPRLRGDYSNLDVSAAAREFGIDRERLTLTLWPFAISESAPYPVRGLLQLLFFLVKVPGRRQADLVVSRSFAGTFAALLAVRAAPVVHEVHSAALKGYQLRILEKVQVLAISPELASLVGERLGHDRVTGLHDPADATLPGEGGREEARRRLGLGAGDTCLVYTGKIVAGQREIDQYLELAGLLREGVRIVLVGGRSPVVEHYRRLIGERGIGNVEITGKLPRDEVLAWQRAADGLLMYYDSSVPTLPYCSPVKMFEYMAAGVPIFGAWSPSIEGVLGDAAFLVEPDRVARFAAVVNEHLGTGEAKRRGEAAKALAGAYDPAERARKVLRFAGLETAEGAPP